MEVLRSARVVSAGTLLSRVLGVVRDGVMAHVLGAGAAADAFAIAYRVPNLLREVVGEGALTSAFLPAYAGRVAAGDRAAAGRLFRTVATLVAGVLGILTLVAVPVFFAIPVEWFRPEGPADAAKLRLILDLCAWCFPYAPLVCVTAIFAAALQAEHRFGPPALAPAAMNLAWIAGMLAFVPLFPGTPEGHARAVAAAVLAGGVVQAAVCLPALRSSGLRPVPALALRDPALASTMRRLLPAALGLAPVQVSLLLNALIAERFVAGDGANSALYYSGRLLQLPLALVGVSVAVAGFPLLARLAAENRRRELGLSVSEGLRSVVFLALPAAAGLALLAPETLALLFRHGRFDAAAADRAATVLRWSLLGLPAFCALQVVTRAFHALGDTSTPVRVGARSVALSLGLGLLLVGPMEERGLALAAAVTAWVNLAILVWIARRRLRLRGMRRAGATALRAAALSAGAVAAAYAAARGTLDLAGDASLAARAAVLAAGVLAGAAAFALPALLLRVPEAVALREALRRGPRARE